MTIHLIHSFDPSTERLLGALVNNLEKIMSVLDTLTTDVQANTDAAASVEQVLQTVVQELNALQVNGSVDPVALKALTDKLEATTAGLAAAVVANTPAATPPVVG